MDGTIKDPADLLNKSGEDALSSPPSSIKKSVELDDHGKAGSFLMRLQRYAVVGWMLFFVTFGFLLISYFLNLVLPKPLLVVDNEGRVMGQIDFFEPVKRLDAEIISGGARFLGFYLSLNSNTIFDEFTVATNMMGPDLLEQAKRMISEDGHLQRIASANTRSDIEFDQEQPPKIIEKGDNETSVRYQGIITVYHENETPSKTPFNITLFMKIHPSTSLRRSGIEIIALDDN